MNSPAEQPGLILIRRLADGRVEWVPLQIPQRVPVTPDASYTLIDRANYEAPQTLVAKHVGQDLVMQVQGTQVLVLAGFFSTADVAFYATTNIAGGAGPFSGSPLTPDSPVLGGSPAGEQVVWSAEHGDRGGEETGVVGPAIGTGGQAGGGSSPLLWVGLGAGGLALVALGGGGGSGGGGSGGGDTTPPQITSGATAPAIAENSGAGQVVYTAVATDAGAVRYSLKAGGDAAAFTINANTGAVTLTANPNFEAKPSYNFTVVATDAASNSAERAIGLAIHNLDEVAPTITSGATATPINENSGADRVIYTVTSTDTDVVTGNTTYSLKAGGDAAAFTINASTGAVTLTGNPDFEAKPSYNFTVVATDAASNSSQQAVSLAINNIPDNVDHTPPAVDHVALTSAVGAQNGILDTGDTVVVTVTMTENTQVNTSGGTPSIELRIGNDRVDADYVSGSGTTSLIFEYTIQPGNEDKDGISIPRNALDPNGSSITDVAGNAADLKSGPVGSNPSFVVDTTAPASSTLGDNTTLNFETGEFILGVAQGSNSDSSRTFQSGVSEVVDIRVASHDALLSTVDSTSGSWGGSANFGSNDRIMLVGNSADSQDPSAAAHPMSITEVAVAWLSSADPNAALSQESPSANSTPLDASMAGAFHDGAEGHTNIISFADMPAGVLTSQGLV